MKKIILIICFCLICESCIARENTYDLSSIKNDKIPTGQNRYGAREKHLYLPAGSDMIYDLSTFEYDEKQDKYSIDLFYDYNMGDYETFSPYDENKYISYLIVKIIIFKKGKGYKLNMKYTGFIETDIKIIDGLMTHCNVKKHYSDKILPELKEPYKILSDNPYNASDKEMMIAQITETIFNAYKKGKLEELSSTSSPLQ